MNDLERIQSQWTRLGAMFSVQPSRKTPDLEDLLIETARWVPGSARLFAVATSWLIQYGRLICRHRLVARIERESDPLTLATMGYMLSLVRDHTGKDHFNGARKKCSPLTQPRPLFNTYTQSEGLARLAKKQSDPLSKRWGLYSPPERLYTDALRPASWVMQTNPTLHYRAIFSGQLTASILVHLQIEPASGKSESALARVLHATRVALRDALDQLELCQLISRQRSQRCVEITLTTPS